MKTRIRTRRIVVLEPLSNGLDTSSLEEDRGAEVTVMFGGTQGLHQTPSVFRTQQYRDLVWKWLEDNQFDSEDDVFVVAGRMTKVAVALAVVKEYVARCGHELRVLMFDGATGRYVERRF